MAESTRWMLGFYWNDTDGVGHGAVGEPNFPEYAFWHSDREVCQAAGLQVLCQLAQQGDGRDWIAHGHPDPFEVGRGAAQPDQWIRHLSQLTERDCQDALE